MFIKTLPPPDFFYKYLRNKYKNKIVSLQIALTLKQSA